MFEFGKPVYVIRDPKICKQIAIKDFDSFADHRLLFDGDADPLVGRALFTLKGQKWRGL
jgi:cytochrome P450 family 9